jgi:hypothetical protein|tara:strand:- start:346 stop:576 length:231 start_codon:yes stop_codon:yes gene_type:complete
MTNIAEKILFEKLKNWYQIAIEIKNEKNIELKTIKQSTARLIFNDLTNIFYTDKILFKKVNQTFKNMSLKEINEIK